MRRMFVDQPALTLIRRCPSIQQVSGHRPCRDRRRKKLAYQAGRVPLALSALNKNAALEVIEAQRPPPHAPILAYGAAVACRARGPVVWSYQDDAGTA